MLCRAVARCIIKRSCLVSVQARYLSIALPRRGLYSTIQNKNGGIEGRYHVAFGQKPKNWQNGSSKNETKKKVVVRWKTGTEKAQMIANDTLRRILKINESGRVKAINPDTNTIEEMSIYRFAKGIDLDKKGFIIVNVEKNGGNIPLVKLVDAKVSIKRYADELAKEKQEELAEMGVLRTNLGKDRVDKSVKYIRISWKINLDDLSRQKAHEIVSALKKGCKVFLYVAEKHHRDWMADFENENAILHQKTRELEEDEKQHRERVYQKIMEMVEEYAGNPSVEGKISSSMIIRLFPKPVNTSKEDRKSLKEQKKKERQLKLQQRLERKRYRLA